jgi:putative spermidine/putrescine transport system permease protein
VLALGPPLLLAVRSFAGGWYWPALVPRAWSARAWAYVFSPSSEVFSSLVLSVGLAAAVTLLALAAAVPGGRALALCRFRGKRAVLLLLLLPVLAPPVASVMGVHAWFVRLGLADTVAGVLLVHLVPAVPYATLMLMGSFTALDPDREAQARTLGAGPVAVWRAVTLPAIAPGLAVAGAFAFMVSWSQYLTTLFIGGGRVVTLPLALVVFQRGGDEAVTAALSLVFLAPAVAVFLLVSRHLAPHD